jgi:hypothetical protein
VFSQDSIKSIFADFVTVRLYVWKVPAGLQQIPDGNGAKGLRDKKLNNEALPYYVVLMPRSEKRLKKIAVYEKPTISSPEEFATFLNKALEASKKVKPIAAAPDTKTASSKTGFDKAKNG